MTSTLVTDPVAHAELRKTLELILADVTTWDQAQWGIQIPLVTRDDHGASACRTAFCVAGHYAVTVAGHAPVWHVSDYGTGSDLADDGADVPIRGMSQVVTGTVGYATVVETVSAVAARGFALNDNQARELFCESNSLRRVLDVAYQVTGGAVDLYAAYDDLVARDPDFALSEREAEARVVHSDHVAAFRHNRDRRGAQ